MQLELNRLATFGEYQEQLGELSCLTLARKGYFYDGRLAACFRCQMPLPRGENITAENLDEAHKRLSLNCSHLEKVNVPLTRPRSPATESDGTLPEQPISAVYKRAWARAKSRGIFPSDPQTSSENPDHERFRDEAVRLNSFSGWPQGAPVRPEELAATGFFYTGTGDRVQCAFCGGVLSGWERGDDPITEHQRHYGARNCPFPRHHRQDLQDGHWQDSVSQVYYKDQSISVTFTSPHSIASLV